jgi:hypothetical protein
MQLTCNGKCRPGNNPRIPLPHVIADDDCPLHGSVLESHPRCAEPGCWDRAVAQYAAGISEDHTLILKPVCGMHLRDDQEVLDRMKRGEVA